MANLPTLCSAVKTYKHFVSIVKIKWLGLQPSTQAMLFHSLTPDRDFRCFYTYEKVLSCTPDKDIWDFTLG